jgi:hypothetical protein
VPVPIPKPEHFLSPRAFPHQSQNLGYPPCSYNISPNFIMAEGKIAVYSVPDLKNTTDDALPNYLTSLKFKRNNLNQDIKLVLGYTAVIIAAVLFVADWKLGWDQTKPYTFPAVVVYFLLNGAFTYWIYFVEKGNIFIGEYKGSIVILASYIPPP